MRSRLLYIAVAICCAFPLAPSIAGVPDNGGPYNARFLEGGIGIEREIGDADPIKRAGAPFTYRLWVKPRARQPGPVTIMALGDRNTDECRCLLLERGKLGFRMGETSIASRAAVDPGRWTHVAAVSDGRTLALFADGREVARKAAPVIATGRSIAIAPTGAGVAHFGGSIVGATVDDVALSPARIEEEARRPPAFDLVQMLDVGVGWEWQKRANIGLFQQQDPWTLPRATTPASKPVAKPLPTAPAVEAIAPALWRINGWRLAAAPDVKADGASLSRPGYDASGWHVATVPGTVLTTLVDRGVYPDPYHGLNNMAIPESLARQDYWYRTRFTVPPAARGKRLRLRFNGINYASEIWIDGRRVGATKGAFTRGVFAFEVTPGETTIAVRVSPPPHPGIPHEQSIRGGVGENGGQLAIDGPTFVATEGWDWIPGIRDRNTGIWQSVELEATGDVRIGDPQVITDLPLPRIDSADIHLAVPVLNDSGTARRVTVTAKFGDVAVLRDVEAKPGETMVRFSPATNAALRIANPTLWWPNGYGDASLHQLALTVSADGVESDRKALRFGIREVSYELSLFDAGGKLRRVDVHQTDGRLRGERLIDVRHVAIKQTPNGWVESLTAAGERSPAVRDIAATSPFPHLTLRVNGVPIAVRGGNWGIDDSLKRVSRERLAPFFRLQKEANMNIIRNWMGNNNEPEFFDLADENGMMVMNDFWQSTQDFQVEPQDPALFLANARDTVSRYRNHPSIVIWFGRNEGVPYPLLNEGLDDVVAELDGTRWYTGSSNVVNLQGSGPYNYRPPEGYFTTLASGFSVETGTPSLSTIDSIEASVPQGDRWPLSDTLAYHDWHFGGNGDTKTFMAALDAMFGPATSLADFERKAQMMNLETHKAMYEGFLGHLWTKNSGRLLWMTHPGWPSNSWQIYSSDYDTHAAYFGAKKATEPLHIQLNLPGNELVILNTTRNDALDLIASVRVTDLTGRELFARAEPVDAKANRATTLPTVPLARLHETAAMLLVTLKLTAKDGAVTSENFYWRGRDAAAHRQLTAMPSVQLAAKLSPPVIDEDDRSVSVTLSNPSMTPALNVKLTLRDANGARVLPAFYSDNYVALMPGESRTVIVRSPVAAGQVAAVSLRGWNVIEADVPVSR